MGFFGRLLGRKSSADDHGDESDGDQQAVLVHLDGTGLPAHVYQECDLETIEERLIEVIDREGLGDFDGDEIGPSETTLYMYGPDAEKLFAGIEGVLRASPLCNGARVEIRRGGPGAESRELRL
jgi:hypothetical protein